MTAKMLTYHEGKQLPNQTKQQKQTVDKKIANEQTRKYTNAEADEIVIGMLAQLQQEGLGIGKPDTRLGRRNDIE